VGNVTGHVDHWLVEEKGVVGVVNTPFLESVKKTQTKNARVRQIMNNNKFNSVTDCGISNS